MCGIVGYTNSDDESLVQKMVETLDHRGPDDRGVYFDKSRRIGLGQTRLSILDVSPLGHQPMWSEERDICIVFNGEIYNHGEIRERLKDKYNFKSTTDTETIIYAYKEFGTKCFDLFEGMFALAIYDFNNSELILCRDRLGKKPLYWFYDGKNLAFGSEIKAIMKYEHFKKDIDIQSFAKYLIYDYVPTPHTIWKNVSKLEAATYIRYDGKKIEKKKYWNVNQSPSTDDFESAKNKLDFMMRRSVQSRLLSDVPLGVFLSGGLDSSAILYYVKQFRQDVDTFSIGFGESSFDESVYAREVSKYFGTNHNEKMFSPKDCADSIQEVLSRIDEPIADASIIPTYLLANFARKKVTVALGGDGGDELFAGYPTFNAYKFYKLIRNIPFGLVKKSADIILRSIPVKFSNFSLDQKIAYFIKYHGADWRLVHDAWLGSFDDARINDVLSASAFSQLRLGDLHESSINSFYEVNQNEVDNRFLYQYLRGYLMDEVMVKVDRATMLNSLEARSPFLDYRIVEYVMSLPYEYKLAGFESKYILKELMKDKLRQNIIHRKKKGFGMPVAEWINGDLGHVFDQMLSNSSLKKTGLFNPDYITKLLSDHRSKKCNNRKELWNIFTFMYWYQTYFL